MSDQSRLVIVEEWSGKFQVNEYYREIAESLVKKYDELRHIAVPSILFVDNTSGSGKNKDKVKYAQIGTIPEKWQDILKQTTNRSFYYMLEVFRKNLEELTFNQVVLILYRELRKIGKDGDLKTYQIEEWGDVLHTVGHDWDGKNRLIPNLLEANGNWELMRQPRLFEPLEQYDKSGSRHMN